MGPLMTVLEAVAYLKVGRSKIYDLIAKGELRPVRIGVAVRFERSELDRYIAAHRTPPRDGIGAAAIPESQTGSNRLPANQRGVR